MTLTQPQSLDNPTINLYGEISKAYAYFNDRLFGGQLPTCIITLQRTPRTMGYVSYKRWLNTNQNRQRIDELAINPEYWMGWPITEVLSTLVHEQCHIWQGAFGAPGRGRYHNQEWAQKMKSVGLMPSSTGLPGGKETGDCVSDYVILDGAFHQALVALLASGFGLSWLDTKPEVCQVPVKIFDLAGRLHDIEGNRASLDANDAAEHRLLPRDEAGEVISLEGFSLGGSPVGALAARRRKTRFKYSCGGCGVNVWGKPGLYIICGACSTAFEAEDEAAP